MDVDVVATALSNGTWVAKADAKGRTYYVNPKTKQSVWNLTKVLRKASSSHTDLQSKEPKSCGAGVATSIAVNKAQKSGNNTSSQTSSSSGSSSSTYLCNEDTCRGSCATTCSASSSEEDDDDDYCRKEMRTPRYTSTTGTNASQNVPTHISREDVGDRESGVMEDRMIRLRELQAAQAALRASVKATEARRIEKALHLEALQAEEQVSRQQKQQEGDVSLSAASAAVKSTPVSPSPESYSSSARGDADTEQQLLTRQRCARVLEQLHYMQQRTLRLEAQLSEDKVRLRDLNSFAMYLEVRAQRLEQSIVMERDSKQYAKFQMDALKVQAKELLARLPLSMRSLAAIDTLE